MQVEDAFGVAVGGCDDQRGDFSLFHEGESGGGEGSAVDGEGVWVHDFAGGALEGVRAVAFEEAAEVAVGDHAEELAGVCAGGEDGGHAQLLAGHLVDDLRHWGGGGDLGECFARVHEVVDAGEALAEAASGVEFGEVFGFPAATSAYLEGEGVAEGEHDRRGGGGGEVEGAGFGVDAGVEDDVACLRESGGGAAAEGDELIGQAFEDGKEIE